jgi:hypothetical protein
MTAEVAIMNKTAVALAADSAVTISQGEGGSGEKIYNTANKLFMLSKHRPVGIMIYDAAAIMGVPWETVLKEYRESLGSRGYKNLEGYARNFLQFLGRSSILFPPDLQAEHFRQNVSGYFLFIRSGINESVKQATASGVRIPQAIISRIVREAVKNHHHEIHQTCKASGIPNTHERRLISNYRRQLDEAREAVFEKLPLSVALRRQLDEIGVGLYCREVLPNQRSGVVIAGFGDEEIYPSVVTHLVSGVAGGKAKYVKNEGQSDVIKEGNQASVIPFAQQQTLRTYISGVDPAYQKFVEKYTDKILTDFPQAVVGALPGISPAGRANMLQTLASAAASVQNDFAEAMEKFRYDRYIGPVLDGVKFLPKDELANMAESLVYLTSLRQRVSPVPETVGGAVDVAVISKGDGFIWIKRKHYFQGDLNHHFFSNYYR